MALMIYESQSLANPRGGGGRQRFQIFDKNLQNNRSWRPSQENPGSTTDTATRTGTWALLYSTLPRLFPVQVQVPVLCNVIK